MGEAKFRREGGRVKEEHACLCFGGRRGGNPGNWPMVCELWSEVRQTRHEGPGAKTLRLCSIARPTMPQRTLWSLRNWLPALANVSGRNAKQSMRRHQQDSSSASRPILCIWYARISQHVVVDCRTVLPTSESQMILMRPTLPPGPKLPRY